MAETSGSADQAVAMKFFLAVRSGREGAFGLGFAHPVVDAGEVDVLPDLR